MKKISFIIMLFVCFFGLEMVNSAGIQEDLAENLLRMHIIANSDSDFDQAVKLKVRDRVLEGKTYDLKEIERIANRTLKKENAGYYAVACFEKSYVPKKEYKNISLPEGYYNCLNIRLGNGEGKNWWCVAYPPLCFSEAVIGELSDEARKMLNGRLNKESMETIIKNGDVNFKFKTVEICQRILYELER